MYILIFDPENKQINFQFIAEDFEGKTHVGWIVVEQPWYSSKSAWTYWLYWNSNGPWGDTILRRVFVKPETIRPYTQIEEIKNNLRRGSPTKLVKTLEAFSKTPIDDEDVVAVIHDEKEFPYELWRESR